MKKDLNSEQQKFLLALARKTIIHYLRNRQMIQVAIDDPELQEKKGAFVTLKVNGELRGCIGYPLPVKPLYQTVIDCAIAAATQDYRFLPLELSELDNLKIEISVLSLPQPVEKIEEIQVGKHGLIISKAHNKGLLLPQVPLEYNWDLETYLRHGCLKAGLDPDEWKRGVKIEIFSAQVFSEEDLGKG